MLIIIELEPDKNNTKNALTIVIYTQEKEKKIN